MTGDELRPARGICLAFLMVAPFWIAVAAFALSGVFDAR